MARKNLVNGQYAVEVNQECANVPVSAQVKDKATGTYVSFDATLEEGEVFDMEDMGEVEALLSLARAKQK